MDQGGKFSHKIDICQKQSVQDKIGRGGSPNRHGD